MQDHWTDAFESHATCPRLMVYGTLKRPYWNSGPYLGAAVLLGEDYTAHADFSMWGTGIPFVGKGNAHVIGQVFEVTAEQLYRCDRLEGHPNWYRREVVETAHFGPAWLYRQTGAEDWNAITDGAAVWEEGRVIRYNSVDALERLRGHAGG